MGSANLAARQRTDALDQLALHGQAVTHWPLGEEYDAATVTVILTLADERPGRPEVQDGRGRRIVRTGLVDLLLDTAVDDRDVWWIGGERWETVRIAGRDAILQTVEIRRAEPLRTRTSRIRGGLKD